MVYLYIVQSLKDKGFYVGITKNLKERIEKHNKGGVNSTKTRRPFILVYIEHFDNYSSARLREIKINSFKGGNEFKKLISN